jgi:hypothetical protein
MALNRTPLRLNLPAPTKRTTALDAGHLGGSGAAVERFGAGSVRVGQYPGENDWYGTHGHCIMARKMMMSGEMVECGSVER